MLRIKTLFPGPDNNVEIKKRPLTLSEFNTEDVFQLTEPGFVQLTTGVIPECTVFINVLTTDGESADGLKAVHTGDHTAVTIGETVYYINRTAGGVMTVGDVGDVETAALVYVVPGDKSGAFEIAVAEKNEDSI
ncbi:MAG: hypothetical protein GY950_34855 [bacterium]|nr:hypothetical protein [bacterium]